MIVPPETIRAAFDKHLAVHAESWDIPHHLDCWGLAHAAFRQRSFADFQKLYDELRGHWQVFRPAKNPPTAEAVYEMLTQIARPWGQHRLSELGLQDCDGLHQLVLSLTGIKPTSDGPSIVAVSKFLHFFNPALFVIVDGGVMWSSVLRRPSLWPQIVEQRQAVAAHLPGVTVTRPGPKACDPASYVAVLLWAGELVRKNPDITAIFTKYVAEHAAGRKLPAGLIHYQAAAVEWFLLGLVELGTEGNYIK